MSIIDIGLKSEAIDWLDDNVEKEQLSTEPRKVEYDVVTDGVDEISSERQTPIYQYAHITDREDVVEIGQHVHLSVDMAVMHKALIYKGEYLFFWTDREAQEAYDRYIPEFGGNPDNFELREV